MRFILSFLISFSLVFAHAPQEKCDHRKVVKILSIDGGGVRGIIPTMILKAIEKKLDNGHDHITKYFDIMAGTSTGALIVLMLNIKNDSGSLKYKLEDIQRFYEVLSQEVFDRSWWQAISSGWGWRSAKYDASRLETLMEQYLNGERLSETYTNVLIPAYNLKSRQMRFFRTSQAKLHPKKNYYIKDIARATSAAPTYFEAAKISNIPRNQHGVYIDGGIGVNNPTISAIVHSIELYGRDNPLFVLSLGCGVSHHPHDDNVEVLNLDIDSMGKIDWASHIVDIIMDSANDVTHYQAMQGLPPKHYYRIQLILDPKIMAMDNGDPKNIAKLKVWAEKFIEDNDRLLTRIAKMITQKTSCQVEAIEKSKEHKN